MEITDYKASYELFECLNEGDGHPIEIETSNLQDNPSFESLRENVKYNVQSKEMVDNDVLILTIHSPNGEKLISAYSYHNRLWTEITDSEYLLKNKFASIEKMVDITFQKLEKVANWEDIRNNFYAFQEIDKNKSSQVLEKYAQFFHWYYWPEKDLFAPSKFLGYQNTTIQNYNSAGSGGITQNALKPFFDKIEYNSPEFLELLTKLKQISKNNHGKTISSKVENGLGGIYILKNQYK